MTNQQLQQLREAIILALHPECDYFLEALGKEADYLIDTPPGVKEKKVTVTYEIIHENFETFAFPLTIGRIMQAINNFEERYLVKEKNGHIYFHQPEKWFDVLCCDGRLEDSEGFYTCFWQLTKDNGAECHLEDQSDEVLFALYDIFL